MYHFYYFTIILTLYSPHPSCRIDNIELGYLSTTPNRAEPVYRASCTCSAGYQGDECQFCGEGYYRDEVSDQCDSECQCNGNSDTCAEDGKCLVSCFDTFLELFQYNPTWDYHLSPLSQ